jgi:hypothetical protein
MNSKRAYFLAIMSVTLLICAGGGGSAQVKATLAGTDFALIDSFVESQVKGWNLPGLALGIIPYDSTSSPASNQRLLYWVWHSYAR